MRLQTFRDVEIALSRLQDSIPKKTTPTLTKETIIEKVTTETEIDSFLAAGTVSHKLNHYFGRNLTADNILAITSIYPTTNNLIDNGKITQRWRNLFLKDWTLDISIIPLVDVASDFGDATHRIQNAYISNLYTYGSVYLNGLSASLPVKTNGSKVLITAAINLASSTEVTGTLPVGKGGTGVTTLPTNRVLLGNGTSAISSVAGLASYSATSIVTGITYTTDVINYKDHAGTNQTKTFLTSVSVATSINLYFTNGVLTNAI